MCIKKMEEMTWREFDSKYNYIVHPPFPVGYNECVMNFGESIARSGISKIVIINHHLDLGHIKAIENVREYLLNKFNIKLLDVSSRIIYLDMKKFIMSGGKCFRENGIVEGYVGSPGSATLEYGEKQFQDMITQTGTIILKFLEDGYIPKIARGIKSAMNHIEWR